mmetsp:Transcript_15427/g.28025  ORF Transcript_15427/g.28025 Transcript_15427/m.28025 type:complete len:316 (-) Transcript_15427:140-1087(-)|eukprot:CAMPEP_0202027910 /NCGR_PEP_ID=MMETSP0905-20130828/62657_1 /ASSEMBLY_ACC=CAM_ASM_000554 /TAXON_ID=420261 /ORGANISM="Thalassiosira antarctica, Strain CCMP982" /LENGTH=315 /DNA_ID=CAMNT_0048591551 /DNA_START=115 /DNA_END=1062 /DNA_ORIENTATION=-
MSQLRQRKPIKNDKGDSPPVPDLFESSSSLEQSFDGDDGATRNGDAANNCEETHILKELPTRNTTPSTLDKVLATFGSFSGSTFTADQGLKILQWSSWAISYATQSKHKNLSPSLRKLYNEVSMTRYVLRFYGFLQSLEGYRSGSWAGGTWDNALIAKIAKYLMAGSMIFYYPLEYVAYAGWQMPQLVRVNANKVSAISCGFWTLYIIGDFWASCLKWKELKKKLGDLREEFAGKKRNDDKEAITDFPKEENALINRIRHIKLQLLRCLLFILPSINWSLPNWATDPLLSELPLNGLMLVEAYTSVYQSLRSMCS